MSVPIRYMMQYCEYIHDCFNTSLLHGEGDQLQLQPSKEHEELQQSRC